MVYAFDFAKLQSINDQAVVAIASEPGTVIVVVRLIAKTDAVLFDLAVSADIKNRGERLVGDLWSIKIARHVQAGQGLKMNSFDNEFCFVDRSFNHRFKRRFGRTRAQAKHIEQLLAKSGLSFLPFFQRLEACQLVLLFKLADLRFKVRGQFRILAERTILRADRKGKHTECCRSKTQYDG